jgi:hypothetical protein
MSKSRVFVVQRTMKYIPEQGITAPKFDLSKAERFGSMEYLLSPTASAFRPDSLKAELHEKLADFNDDDYLLLIGSPVLIGMSLAIAAYYNNGIVKVLQWSGKNNDYCEIRVDTDL